MGSIRAAIVRPPARTFSRGITTSSGLGSPDLALALEQHETYVGALEACGVQPIRLNPDSDYPDSTFVEDTAIIAPGGAILARPGAPSRQGEVDSIRGVLERASPPLRSIVAPGTVDGGDVCEAGLHYFIGLSVRTNEDGARQLAELLNEDGCQATLIEIRGIEGLLHLKTGMAALGERRLVVNEALARHDAFREYEQICVPAEESYAANCLLVNGRVLIAAGFPRFERALRELDYSVVTLQMSEFQKMDGGLSCLSLRLGSLQHREPAGERAAA